MSGSGPDYTPSTPGPNNPKDCRTLNGRGTIMSPVPAVLATLNVNDILDIKLRTMTGPPQAFTLTGQLCWWRICYAGITQRGHHFLYERRQRLPRQDYFP